MRQRLERRLERAPDSAAAIGAFLRTVCRSLDWPGAVFYQVDPPRSRRLRATHQFVGARSNAATGRASPRRFSPAPRSGLEAEVLRTGEPSWKPESDARAPQGSRRQAQGRRATGALAIPVRVGRRLRGIAQFDTPAPFEPDAALLWSLGEATNRLGQRIVELHAEHRPKH